jgi:hypothetical protein
MGTFSYSVDNFGTTTTNSTEFTGYTSHTILTDYGNFFLNPVSFHTETATYIAPPDYTGASIFPSVYLDPVSGIVTDSVEAVVCGIYSAYNSTTEQTTSSISATNTVYSQTNTDTSTANGLSITFYGSFTSVPAGYDGARSDIETTIVTSYSTSSGTLYSGTIYTTVEYADTYSDYPFFDSTIYSYYNYSTDTFTTGTDTVYYVNGYYTFITSFINANGVINEIDIMSPLTTDNIIWSASSYTSGLFSYSVYTTDSYAETYYFHTEYGPTTTNATESTITYIPPFNTNYTETVTLDRYFTGNNYSLSYPYGYIQVSKTDSVISELIPLWSFANSSTTYYASYVQNPVTAMFTDPYFYEGFVVASRDPGLVQTPQYNNYTFADRRYGASSNTMPLFPYSISMDSLHYVTYTTVYTNGYTSHVWSNESTLLNIIQASPSITSFTTISYYGGDYNLTNSDNITYSGTIGVAEEGHKLTTISASTAATTHFPASPSHYFSLIQNPPWIINTSPVDLYY